MDERKVFHDSVVPIPVESGPAPHGLMVQAAVSEHRDERMTVDFVSQVIEKMAAYWELIDHPRYWEPAARVYSTDAHKGCGIPHVTTPHRSLAPSLHCANALLTIVETIINSRALVQRSRRAGRAELRYGLPGGACT